MSKQNCADCQAYSSQVDELIDDKDALQARIKALGISLVKGRIATLDRDDRIKELETGIIDVCDLIDKEGEVSKWKIHNWLSQALKQTPTGEE